MNKSVSFDHPVYGKKFLEIKREIFLLEEDFKRVKHSGIKRAIKNQILQKQGRLALFTVEDKARAPGIPNKTLDKPNSNLVK